MIWSKKVTKQIQIKGPDYWMHSLRLLQVFDTLVTELDAPCVEELEDVTSKHHNDKGFVEETSEEKDTFIFLFPYYHRTTI